MAEGRSLMISSRAGSNCIAPVMVVICWALVAGAWGCGDSEGRGSPTAPALLASSPQAGGPTVLTSEVIGAMSEAIQDEYHALFTYTGVITDLGGLPPFVSIRDAEGRHVDSIRGLFATRGLAPPSSVWNESNVPDFALLTDACRAGKEIERTNVAMYEGFLLLELPADVRMVFLNLLTASRDQHLPAFERCINRYR
jgi:hypothetical protein